MRICTHCERRLALHEMATTTGGRILNTCRLCYRDDKRMSHPLAPAKRDPVQVQLNNAASLWHGPVQRSQPLRNAA